MAGIALNDNQEVDVRIVGVEQTPVLVIDQPLVSAEDLLADAVGDANFLADRRFAYPGIHAELPDSYVDTLLPDLRERLRAVYEIPSHLEPCVVRRLYSLITTPPEDLAPLQRVPHFDALNTYYFATVHYLADGPYSGTGIFRHRPTGFERISESRYPDFVQAAEAHMKTHGLPDAKYIDSTTEHFELIEAIEYKPNRLIVYPGNLLHSGLIQPENDVSWDPSAGRLTANLFIDFVEPGSA
jgi:hypothetical protein